MSRQLQNMIFLFVLVFFIYSCKHDIKDKGVSSDVIEQISIDPLNIPRDNINASRVIKNIEHIPLETPPNIIIGTIDKFIVKNNKYYIFDKTAQSIFIFTIAGKFISKINSIGRGPGEYTDISSFNIDQTKDNICIYNNRLRKMLYFTSEGKFINERKFNFLFRDFISIDNEINYLYLSYFPDYSSKKFPYQHRYLVTSNDTIVDKQLHYKYEDYYNKISKASRHFYSCGDSITLIEGSDNKIYRIIKDGQLIYRYKVDFGKFNSPLKAVMDKEESDYYITNSVNEKWCKLSNVIETPRYLFINYIFNHMYQSSYYSKITRKIFNCGPFWINDYAHLPIPRPIASQDSILFSVVDAFAFKNWFRNNKNEIPIHLLELNNKVKELDNPIIIKYQIKKF